MSIQGPRRVQVRFAATLSLALLPAMFTACGGVPEASRDEDVVSTTSAITRVVNVSTVDGLYSAFRTANSSADTIEIHLAPGTYVLKPPSGSDPNDTWSQSAGSLKVLRASNVKLIGGRDISDAWNYVIDGGWSSGTHTSLLYVAGDGNPRPSLSVTGVVLQNSFPFGPRSPVQVVRGIVSMKTSIVFNNRTERQGGGGLYVNNGSSVTISRCSFSNNSLAAAVGTGTTCGGLFDSGGNAAIANSSATIEYSTFMSGLACRGGGLFLSGNPSHSFVISQSTFTGNQAKTRGGGLMILGSPNVSLDFNTLSGNTAGAQSLMFGQELHVAGGLSVQNSTADSTGTLKLVGNIIAQNQLTQFAGGQVLDGIDVYLEGPGPAPIVTQNGNLIGERGNFTFLDSSNLVGTHASPVDARLYLTSDLGGGQFSGTIAVKAPLSDSPALHGYHPTSTLGCPGVDQIGMFRFAPCTIGSVENAIF